MYRVFYFLYFLINRCFFLVFGFFICRRIWWVEEEIGCERLYIVRVFWVFCYMYNWRKDIFVVWDIFIFFENRLIVMSLVVMFVFGDMFINIIRD